MSFKELLKQVESNDLFKEFKKKHPKAKLYSAFFTLRKAHGNILLDSQQLDYVIGKKEVFSFFMQNNEVQSKEDKLNKEVKDFKELDKNIKIDIEEVKKIILKEKQKQKISTDFTEMVIILQKLKGKQIWNTLMVLPSLEILRIHIGMDGKILSSKREGFMNFIKVKKGKKK
ncbi:MAG: hypothetical protein JSW08_00495 [archaeon]|nr:MAG: hypothetical protein JSW08_00495 [archaeon]